MSYTRVYFGRIPRDTEIRDLESLCTKYGRVRDVKVLNGFGFVEFDDPRDAADAVRGLDRMRFLGETIQVEPARGGRRDRDRDIGGGAGGGGPRRDRAGGPRGTGEYRLKVTNLPRGTSWQDLKDLFRRAGEVRFADVDRDGDGVVEFSNRDDMDKAIRDLDDYEFRESRIYVKEDRSAPRQSPSPRRNRSPRRSPSPRRRSPSPRRDRSPRDRSRERSRD